jgi:eukaryotic-like serine/threonine-protein kinase
MTVLAPAIERPPEPNVVALVCVDEPVVVKPPRRKRRVTLAPGKRIGPWRIDREIGRGGMAAVYAVTHTQFGKRAALKLCHQQILSQEFTPATFLREARIANLIEDPGVTDVFATGTFDGRPYLVMEKLGGASLGHICDAGPLPRTEALSILIELCDVLAAAHKAGVVHRDLKLDNVFVQSAPGAGGRRVKLLDWGVAAILGEHDPMRGLICGTLTYVAPDQVRGDEITPAADVYSLAVMAYQLLLGEPPFASPSDLELVRKHVLSTPPDPATLWATIPPELAKLMVAMLAKHPEDRPSLDKVREMFVATKEALRPRRRWFPRLMRPDVFGRRVAQLDACATHPVVAAALGIALTVASIALVVSV